MAEIINMPKLGFDMAEGTLIRWVKTEGERVEKGELIAEIETDKATVEVESLYSGTVRKHLVSEGAIVPVNTPIVVIGEPDEDIDLDALTGGDGAAPEPVAAAQEETTPEPGKASAPVSAPSEPELAQLPGGVRASPLARRIAEDKGVDLKLVRGTGPGGRIVKKDVEAALAAPAAAAAPALSVPPLAAADLGSAPEDRHVPLSRLRQAIGRRMVDSKQNYPHFYVTTEVDLGPLMELRKQANTMLAESGEKLSVNDFIVKATALALRRFPNLNAALDGDGVVQYGRINVGIAVSVENGLLTVVVPDADRKSVRQISQEVKQKAGRARDGRVQPDDISGSTFSVSNLGMYNVDSFTAIINPPEAAILAIGSGKQVPVVKDGELTVGWRMKGTISVDHRVSDGAEAAEFMALWAELLENPVGMLL